MAAPEGLTLDHHRDLAGRERRPLVRQVLVGLIAAILVLGLFNVFGQRVTVNDGESSAARLEVSAPTKLRGGLLYRLYLHFQVNPTALGTRSQSVDLYDGERKLISLDRDALVWPGWTSSSEPSSRSSSSSW